MIERKKQSDEVLKAISKHIVYEFQMLQQTCELARNEDMRLKKNAFLESFAVHARNLLDFFYAPQAPRPDDVIAEDFFDDPSVWHDNRPEKSSELKKVHRRVGKEIAHLTYERLATMTRGRKWANSKITNEVRNIFLCFMKITPPGRLGEAIKKFFGQEAVVLMSKKPDTAHATASPENFDE